MSEPGNTDRGWKALLIAMTTAIAGYLPVAYLYDTITRPGRFTSGEHSLAHGLEVLFIAGPAGALILAAIAGWMSYRATTPTALRVAWGFIAACVVASVIIAQWTRLL